MLLTKPKTGSVLVSEPAINGDASFQRSVVLLADYNENGSIGFIMNKPLSYTLSDVIDGVTKEFRIYNGGPVEQDSLYFIHKVPHLIPGSVEICSGVYWGGDFQVVANLIVNGSLSPEEIKFFLGYSGWTFNQICEEIEDNFWVVTSCDLCEMISEPSIDHWKNKMKELGGEYLIWANSPDNPAYN